MGDAVAATSTEFRACPCLMFLVSLAVSRWLRRRLRCGEVNQFEEPNDTSRSRFADNRAPTDSPDEPEMRTMNRTTMTLAVAMLVLGIAATQNSFGQSTTWNGGAGNWSDKTQWNPNPCAPNPPCYPNNPLWSVSIDGGNSNASPVTKDILGGIGILNLTIDGDDSLTNQQRSLSVDKRHDYQQRWEDHRERFRGQRFDYRGTDR